MSFSMSIGDPPEVSKAGDSPVLLPVYHGGGMVFLTAFFAEKIAVKGGSRQVSRVCKLAKWLRSLHLQPLTCAFGVRIALACDFLRHVYIPTPLTIEVLFPPRSSILPFYCPLQHRLPPITSEQFSSLFPESLRLSRVSLPRGRFHRTALLPVSNARPPSRPHDQLHSIQSDHYDQGPQDDTTPTINDRQDHRPVR